MASSKDSVIFSGSASSHLPKTPKEKLSSSPKPYQGPRKREHGEGRKGLEGYESDMEYSNREESSWRSVNQDNKG